MAAIDWAVVAGYMAAMLGISAWLSGRQRGLADYYLGGRALPAGAVGISTLATQSSAISFISIPAFVALRPDGGLRFLQYEIALPLSMAFLALWLVPALRRAGVFTIYEYLEQRFDPKVRRAVAALFLLGRGLSTSVALYATALVLQACLGTSLFVNVALLGAVTVMYDLLGGMTAVVYSDVIQMAVLALALGLCVVTVVDTAGGPATVLAAFPDGRWQAFAGPATGNDSIWSYIFGGVFLYASYYGCDQSQAQRLLSTPSVRDSQRALILNGLCRFPLILGYCILGVAAAAAFQHSPRLQAALNDGPPDLLVPQLIRTFLPAGARGLVFAGLLAAAMSSLDSALNALSASSVRDFGPAAPEGVAHDVRRARLWTLAWGGLIAAFACVVGDIGKTVIEAINKVGSAVYGPVLAVFVLSLMPRPVSGTAALCGLAMGFGVNLALWVAAPGLHFLWWNPIGCLLGLGLAFGVDRARPRSTRPAQRGPTVLDHISSPGEPAPPLTPVAIVAWLTLATAVILGSMWALHRSQL